MNEQQKIMNDLAQGGPVLVLGYGVTGQALADFCERRAVSYFLCDERENLDCTGKYFCGFIKATPESGESLVQKNIKMVFPSPGVSLTHPVVQKAKKEGLPVVGELELASFYLKGDFIAVTGTNGKSTTVKLIDALLNHAGISSSLKGNIGSPLISAVYEPPKSYYVIEESSFQLELAGSLHHKISVCLNVTDDHFERYNSLNEYAKAKSQIITNSGPDDVFIYNADDRYCLNMSVNSRALNLPFSLVHEFDEGAFVKDQKMVIRFKNKEFCFDVENCALKGLHNLENMLAALLAVLVIKNDAAAIQSYEQTLKTFVGLSHRLELIHTHQGVDYFDDSKATNVGSVVMALASFEDSIILIAGGRDKLGDYAPLKGLIKAKVKKLILLGEAKERMYEVFKEVTPVEKVENMHEAVMLAFKTAVSGDKVLLSPACSSFDQYENYKVRGDDFKKKVKEICKA